MSRLSLCRCELSLASVMLSALVGCQTLSPALVPCPISSVEQATRVQELAPIGMDRDQAVAVLKKNGISGTYATAKSMFYCDTWQRNDKERWLIDVQILFNEQGQVYGYRPDPKAVAAEPAGTAKVTKEPKQVAAVKQAGFVDPFSE